MAGSVTAVFQSHRPTRKYVWQWTSDSSGDVNGFVTIELTGTPLRIVFIPDGSDAPTDDYDVTILDSDGADILRATGANRDTANIEQLTYGDATEPGTFSGTLQLIVTNAGNAKKGQVVMYFR